MNFEDFNNFRLAYRKKLIRFISIYLTIVIILLAINSLFFFTATSDFKTSIAGIFIYTTPVLLIISFLAFVIFYLFAAQARSDYKKAYKAYFVSQVFSKTFDHYKYEKDGGIPEEKIATTHLLRRWNRFSTNDLVTGKYKGVDFSQCDARASMITTDSDGHTNESVIFYGRWLIFNFNKKSSRIKIVGRKFRNSTKPSNRHRIELESPSFNHAFSVFGDDGMEVRYILTPDLMERLERLAISHHYKILVGFIDNQLHIAIANGKDSFEPPSPLKNINKATEIAKITNDTKLITDIVDTLKLHRR